MKRSIEITDDMITDYLAYRPAGDDPCSDAANYPYTFLQGYRDAEEGKERDPDSDYSMAEGNAYDLGRFEYEGEYN